MTFCLFKNYIVVMIDPLCNRITELWYPKFKKFQTKIFLTIIKS